MKPISHCWHCNRQLMRKKGGFHFAVLINQLNQEVRVHKDCVSQAVGGGVKEKKQ